MDRIDREKHTVGLMVRMYCRHHHAPAAGRAPLCPECRELLRYCHARLSRCPFGGRKTSCRLCRVHCYTPAMRAAIRRTMRWAGPRMLFSHPVAAIRHLLDERFGH